jgi:two-component system phosphate regulon sensor histidine kinase PhoR
MKKTFFLKLYPAMMACVVLPMAALAIAITIGIREFGIALSEYQIGETARIAATALKHIHATTGDLDAAVRSLSESTKLRLTVIQADGVVLFDSLADPATMENHGNRAEVRAALETGIGYAFRSSATINEESAYSAVLLELPGGVPPWVVRVSLPLPLIGAMLSNSIAQILATLAFILIAAAVGTWFLARHLRKPVARLEATAIRWASGQLGARATVKTPWELARLAETMNTMATDLQQRMSHLEQSREETLAILNSMVEAVVVTDSFGRVAALNPRAAGLFGTTVLSGVDPRDRRSLLELSHATALAELEEKARLGQAQEANIEWFGAERLNLQVSAAPLARQGGAVVVLNDITRLMKLETIRKDFVANVSHELKTPIQSIKGFVETLESGAIDSPEDTRRFLGIIQRNTGRLEAIIDDLLSLARLEGLAEKGGINKTLVDIRQVVDAVRETLRDAIAARRIEMVVEGDGSPLVAGSEGLLEQLLLNLVDNAVKYCPEGSRVAIRWSGSEADGASLFNLEVADNGPGMPPRDLERIFERFYRVEKSRHRDSGGTGLGLAIVRHIALLHGGSIAVRSQPGHGSTFTLTLPRS